MIQYILNSLFPFEKPYTKAQHLYFRGFELIITFYTIKYTWEWLLYSRQNVDVVLPLGIAHYFDVSFFFSYYPNVILSIVTSIAVILGFAKIWRAGSYTIAMIGLHLAYATRFSLGEIPHSMNMIGMGLFSLMLASCFYKDDAKRSVMAFGFAFFYVGLAYTSASISKLIATGITWVDGRHLWLWMNEKSIDILSREGVFAFNILQETAFESWGISTLILIFGLTAEAFGFLFWFPKTRPFAATLILGMHVGILLSMNIWFGSYMVELIYIGYPWVCWLGKIGKKASSNQTLTVLSNPC